MVERDDVLLVRPLPYVAVVGRDGYDPVADAPIRLRAGCLSDGAGELSPGDIGEFGYRKVEVAGVCIGNQLWQDGCCSNLRCFPVYGVQANCLGLDEHLVAAL